MTGQWKEPNNNEQDDLKLAGIENGSKLTRHEHPNFECISQRPLYYD